MKAIKMLMMAALTIFSVAVFAQDTTKQKSKMKMEQMKYSCPMHPEVTSKKPGKCSKCRMDLTKSKKEQMKMEVMKMYSCPMHADVTSDKPGKCSKCGMDMTKMKKDKMEMSAMKTYACPMHPDVTSDKAGKCSKCGMDLKEMPAVTYACPMQCEGDKTYDKPGKCPKCGMDLKEKTEKKDDHSGHKH